MNTFPITNEKLVSEYDHVYKDHRIPVLDWGKKYYLIYNGSLHAIIPLFVALACKKGEFELGIKPWLGCKVAGEDKVKLFECGGCYGFDHPSGLKLFLTPEDYDRFCEDGKSGRHIPGSADLYQIIADRCAGFKFEYGYSVPELWWFSPYSHQPVLDRVKYKDVWIDEDGAHATIVTEGKDGRRYFFTKEECMAANKKAVVEFDDDETPAPGSKGFENTPSNLMSFLRDVPDREPSATDPVVAVVVEDNEGQMLPISGAWYDKELGAVRLTIDAEIK